MLHFLKWSLKWYTDCENINICYTIIIVDNKSLIQLYRWLNWLVCEFSQLVEFPLKSLLNQEHWVRCQLQLGFWHSDFAEQRQHHYQRDELRNKCVRRLCHLLHPGLHGAAPGRGRVRGGWPRARPGLHRLPRSPDAAAHLATLVAAFLLHAHPAGTRHTGKLIQSEGLGPRM